MLIGYGLHDAAHGQAVEIIVYENKYAQGYGCKLGSRAAFDFFFGKMTKRGGTAGTVHQAYHSAENHKEYQDADVVAVRKYGGKAVVKYVCDGAFKGKVGDEQAADQNSYKERAVDLFCDKSQHNCNYRGDKSPEGCIHGRQLRRRFFCRKCNGRHKQKAKR